MAKHRFVVGKMNAQGELIGAQCLRCGKIALFKDRRIPEEIDSEECPVDDPRKAAARIVSELGLA